jgi:hypothetical protein
MNHLDSLPVAVIGAGPAGIAAAAQLGQHGLTPRRMTHGAQSTAADAIATSGCCGGEPPPGVDACCALDAAEKAKGNGGCGSTCDSSAKEAGATGPVACCSRT